MIWLISVLLTSAPADSALLEPLARYSMPDSINGYWMQRPHSLVTDGLGRLFISDQDARTVFVWDETGKPTGTWGRPGHGPGEFRGPTFLDFAGGHLHVLDPPAQRIEVFNAEGEPVRTVTLRGIFTSPMGFLARADGGYVLVVHAVLEPQPAMKTVFLDGEGQLEKVVHAFPDKSFKLVESETFGMQLTAYSGETTLSRSGQGYAVACGYAPEIQLFDKAGGLKRTITLGALQARLVYDADRREFLEMEIPWMDGSFKPLKDLKQFIQVDFPKYMPFFTGVASLASGEFLVYELSKASHVLTGWLYSAKGQRLSQGRAPDVSMNLGWQGTFHLSGAFLYTLSFLEDQEVFQIEKSRWQLPGGS